MVKISRRIPHSGGRPLVGLDERRMVVAFHFKRHGEAVADIDDAGVLARPLEHVRSLGGKLFQVMPRALVATVLRPHDREDPKLGIVRFPAEQRDDLPILFRRQTMAGH